MAKVVFKFFEANLDDTNVVPFIKEMEGVLNKFAGGAYHFRYYLDEPLNMTRPKTQRNGSKTRNAKGNHINKF